VTNYLIVIRYLPKKLTRERLAGALRPSPQNVPTPRCRERERRSRVGDPFSEAAGSHPPVYFALVRQSPERNQRQWSSATKPTAKSAEPLSRASYRALRFAGTNFVALPMGFP
jgi:hypothetical protein